MCFVTGNIKAEPEKRILTRFSSAATEHQCYYNLQESTSHVCGIVAVQVQLCFLLYACTYSLVSWSLPELADTKLELKED